MDEKILEFKKLLDKFEEALLSYDGSLDAYYNLVDFYRKSLKGAFDFEEKES